MMTEDENIKQKNPFRVPENYFDEVSRKIIAETIDRKKAGKQAVYLSFRTFLAAAAGIAILITIGFFSTRISVKNEPSRTVSQILSSDPEILFDEIDLLTLENSELFTGGSNSNELSDDEIIDYLVSEDVDISMILEKL